MIHQELRTILVWTFTMNTIKQCLEIILTLVDRETASLKGTCSFQGCPLDYRLWVSLSTNVKIISRRNLLTNITNQ